MQDHQVDLIPPPLIEPPQPFINFISKWPALRPEQRLQFLALLNDMGKRVSEVPAVKASALSFMDIYIVNKLKQ